MRKAILLFLCFITSLTFAQKESISEDTVKAVTNAAFNVPSFGAISLQNVLKIDYSAELLDANQNKIMDITNFTQKPTKEELALKVKGGRGATVNIVLHPKVEQPGRYYAKLRVSASTELGSATKEVFYPIIVSYPTLAAPIDVRSSYFYTESATFSFATIEYNDPTKYSFVMTDDGGNTLVSGKGPIVKLDTLTNNINNVGKRVTVKGLYEGKEFTFGQNGQTGATSWQFTIDKPAISKFNSWASDQQKTQDTWITPGNPSSKSFLFTYFGKTPNGYVAIKPEVKNLSVRSDPENFVSGARVRGGGGVFSYIDIDVNPEFMELMEVGSDVDIKLTITFRTQFGEQVREEYYGLVIK